jgi:DNA-directed RNA polymerase II subunit RPB2
MEKSILGMLDSSKILIYKWYEEYGLNHHHIHSFNLFITQGLRQIIQSTPISFVNSKGVEINIEIDNIWIPEPFAYDEYRKKIHLTPHECRKMNLTYSSPIFVSVTEKKIENKQETINHYDRIIMSHIPIMVRSKYCVLSKQPTQSYECMNDPGGYFIINGIERVLVTQQRNMYNMVQIFEQKDKSKYAYNAEIRSMSEDTNHSVLVEAFITTEGDQILFTLPYVKTNVLLSILLLGFGVSEQQLVQKLTLYFTQADHQKHMIYSIQQMYRQAYQLNIQTCSDALSYIGNLGTKQQTDIEQYGHQVLHIELFPHLGIYSKPTEKVELLTYIIYRLFAVYFGIYQVHDKDNLAYKRFESSGILLYELFKSLYRSCVNELENDYEKSSNLVDIFGRMDGTITKNIKYCFSTGKWGIQRNSYIRQGVSQVLSRLSYISMLSHLQRIVIPVGKEGKNFKIRQIHPSGFGYICLYETPEGQSCGIVLNMTLTTRISDQWSVSYIRRIIFSRLSQYIHDIILESQAKDNLECILFLNGMIMGYTQDPKTFVKQLRALRVQKILPHDLSIAWDFLENEIRIYCDKGRLIRPFIVKGDEPTLLELAQEAEHFSDLVSQGRVEWLDSNEVQSLVIAMYPQEKNNYTHYEIHPSLLLGVCAGAIPFLDHNQSPRNVYEASMMKQAIGMFATNYNFRYDAVYHTLDYPQKSLISTYTARLVGMHEMPAGINCIVAISTYGGWNAEDSIIINKSAIERGLFSSNTYHTYTFEDKIYKTETCKRICVPPIDIQKPEWNYYHLDSNGIVRKGAYVDRNDVLIGQVYINIDYKDGERVQHFIDCSELSEECGIVDRVETICTPSGNRLIKIIIRQVRIPEIGDKFANMAAQKGTCALIVPAEDLPFTSEGIVPDIMMNSHALPSRMTISMLLEMVLGKANLVCNSEKLGLRDGTPFSESSINPVQQLEKELCEGGYESHGWECMYNGQTGKPLRSKIFIGPSYYQKLKHMVSDKIHARSYGNVTSLTRQPLAGRSRDGGLRLGEMEQQCLVSHGSVQFLKERLFDSSDPFSVLLCNDCGTISNMKDECHKCKNNELSRVNIPYAAKLLFQILNGCLVGTRFHSSTK